MDYRNMIHRRDLITGTLGVAAGLAVSGGRAVALGPSGELAGTFTDGDGNITDLSGTVTLSASSGVVDVLGATATPRFAFVGHVVLPSDYTLTQDATIDSLYTNGHTLTIAPGVTLRSRGNIINDSPIIIDGRGDPSLATVVEFIDVDESAMVGSRVAGMEIVDTDVGLWTVSGGTLVAHGAPKRAWSRSTGPIAAGQSTFTADASLDGWRVGDEIVVTPTAPGRFTQHHRSTVTAVSGSTFTLAAPTTEAHPTVNVWGRSLTAEFLNLTRNVKIQGQPGHRAHTVFFHCNQPQHLSHVEYAHLGPMGPQAAGNPQYIDPHTHMPLGRWALHFHHGMVNGSTVDGVVCHDIGSYAFVPHKVDTVTFTGCVAHNVGVGAFWWDDNQAVAAAQGIPPSPLVSGDASNNITYDRCVASHVYGAPAWNGTPTIAALSVGFLLGNGAGNRALDCVASGVFSDYRFEGGAFSWMSNDSGLWPVDGCVAHNSVKGFDLWSNNSSNPFTMANATQYSCQVGLRDGAYRTVWGWADTDVVGNVRSVAGKCTTGTLAPNPDIVRLRVDAAGRHPYAFTADTHHVRFDINFLVVRVANSSFKGGTVACVGFTSGGGVAHLYEFTDCTFTGKAFWFEPSCPAASVVTLRQTGQPTRLLRPSSYAGSTAGMTWSADWNCWVQTP